MQKSQSPSSDNASVSNKSKSESDPKASSPKKPNQNKKKKPHQSAAKSKSLQAEQEHPQERLSPNNEDYLSETINQGTNHWITNLLISTNNVATYLKTLMETHWDNKLFGFPSHGSIFSDEDKTKDDAQPKDVVQQQLAVQQNIDSFQNDTTDGTNFAIDGKVNALLASAGLKGGYSSFSKATSNQYRDGVQYDHIVTRNILNGHFGNTTKSKLKPPILFDIVGVPVSNEFLRLPEKVKVIFLFKKFYDTYGSGMIVRCRDRNQTAIKEQVQKNKMDEKDGTGVTFQGEAKVDEVGVNGGLKYKHNEGKTNRALDSKMNLYQVFEEFSLIGNPYTAQEFSYALFGVSNSETTELHELFQSTIEKAKTIILSLVNNYIEINNSIDMFLKFYPNILNGTAENLYILQSDNKLVSFDYERFTVLYSNFKRFNADVLSNLIYGLLINPFNIITQNSRQDILNAAEQLEGFIRELNEFGHFNQIEPSSEFILQPRSTKQSFNSSNEYSDPSPKSTEVSVLKGDKFAVVVDFGKEESYIPELTLSVQFKATHAESNTAHHNDIERKVFRSNIIGKNDYSSLKGKYRAGKLRGLPNLLGKSVSQFSEKVPSTIEFNSLTSQIDYTYQAWQGWRHLILKLKKENREDQFKDLGFQSSLKRQDFTPLKSFQQATEKQQYIKIQLDNLNRARHRNIFPLEEIESRETNLLLQLIIVTEIIEVLEPVMTSYHELDNRCDSIKIQIQKTREFDFRDHVPIHDIKSTLAKWLSIASENFNQVLPEALEKPEDSRPKDPKALSAKASPIPEKQKQEESTPSLSTSQSKVSMQVSTNFLDNISKTLLSLGDTDPTRDVKKPAQRVSSMSSKFTISEKEKPSRRLPSITDTFTDSMSPIKP